MGVFSRLFGDDDAHILNCLESWDKGLSEGFNQDMHNRVCENSAAIYAVIWEARVLLDRLICEETYSFTFARTVRERLCVLIRAIDGITDEEDEQV